MCVCGCIELIIAGIGVAAGGFLIAVGIGHSQMPDELGTLVEKVNIPQPHTVLIVIGVIIVVISLFTLLKVIRSSTIGKLIFCGLIGALVFGLGIIAFLVFYRREEFYAEGIEIYDDAWEERDVVGASDLLDIINQFLQCCGPNSTADYSGEIPSSCCEAPIDDVCPVDDLFKNGCHKALTAYLASKADWIGCAAIAIGILLSFIVLGILCC